MTNKFWSLPGYHPQVGGLCGRAPGLQCFPCSVHDLGGHTAPQTPGVRWPGRRQAGCGGQNSQTAGQWPLVLNQFVNIPWVSYSERLVDLNQFLNIPWVSYSERLVDLNQFLNIPWVSHSDRSVDLNQFVNIPWVFYSDRSVDLNQFVNIPWVFYSDRSVFLNVNIPWVLYILTSHNGLVEWLSVMTY